MNRPAARMRAAGLLLGIGLLGAAGTLHAQEVTLVSNIGQACCWADYSTDPPRLLVRLFSW